MKAIIGRYQRCECGKMVTGRLNLACRETPNMLEQFRTGVAHEFLATLGLLPKVNAVIAVQPFHQLVELKNSSGNVVEDELIPIDR